MSSREIRNKFYPKLNQLPFKFLKTVSLMSDIYTIHSFLPNDIELELENKTCLLLSQLLLYRKIKTQQLEHLLTYV